MARNGIESSNLSGTTSKEEDCLSAKEALMPPGVRVRISSGSPIENGRLPESGKGPVSKTETCESIRGFKSLTFRQRLIMKILQINGGMEKIVDHKSVHEAHVVILDGVVVKNRDGENGARVGDSLLIWDEKKGKIPE